MRLERLEISGFKSFSDRSSLSFDQGVTAIVGPNGCGKSNVADAITWVMGEQSAKSLRGDKMEDVIFNGSDARKPTASAEVRLRFSGVVKSVSAPVFFDDQTVSGDAPADAGTTAPPQFSRVEAEEIIQTVAREVEVTRRLYRSGESEYLIDGQTCRLRDIHDLLMDTGLGAKAYAIIEQGKIGLILSTRPTDRRQLIEEAAGVTKYKARRRSAELKLDAAQQNLTRIDDIVFEVEKQRGTLKRQAGRARRYQTLRDELRRWEKVLFARKYRQLAETIEHARTRLADAREREAASAARVSEVESDFGRTRIELAEAESRATAARETTHARELSIARLQQQMAFDGEQADSLSARARAVEQEMAVLDGRREPAQLELAERRDAASAAVLERDRAQTALATDAAAVDVARREIDGCERAVDAARATVYQAANAVTALRHSLEGAAASRDRVLESLSKLQIEFEDIRIEGDRVSSGRASAAESLRHAQQALEATRTACLARESEYASATLEHEWRARVLRAREQDLAGLEARLASLQELESARVEYGDAARTVLAQADARVAPRGAVADVLEVQSGFERAVEAYAGALLQHVIVDSPAQAEAGFALVREADAGQVGFLVAVPGATLPAGEVATAPPAPAGCRRLIDVVSIAGPYAAAVEAALGPAWIAPTYAEAARVSATAPCPVVTADGDVFRGPFVVTGGRPREARGILETKRDIRELRDRVERERAGLASLSTETAEFDAMRAQATDAIAALTAESHRQEKAMVVLEAQLQRAADDAVRVLQRGDQLARERQQAEEERLALELRQEEARAAILEHEAEQRVADEQLAEAQAALQQARERADALARRAADAGAVHAALGERASALASEVRRLEEAALDMARRSGSLSDELSRTTARVAELRAAVTMADAALTDALHELETLRAAVQEADDTVSTLRISADAYDASIRVERHTLEAIRTEVSESDVARATAEADLSHLAATCAEAVQATLEEVLVEVEALERDGRAVPDAAIILADEPEEPSDEAPATLGPADTVTATDGSAPSASSDAVAAADGALAAATQRTLSAEEAITTLRRRIERLGPVNMMAIEQYDELEARHAFLTTQRLDLIESIAQTTEAIARIDETTRVRFVEAFTAINRYFGEIFHQLFGGGRAGLTLLDENDPLESGIEIVAQPPGKRLQSVQLLSGGEKALTAISLMFGLFKFKPSPFCLLDEIDAPLDDANVGRFVEMLRSMQEHTQFILITHHRKTMEIADRLYGVTMEEPGVSKLISVQLSA